MNIVCPGCGARYRVRSPGTAKSEARLRCPKCAHVFSVRLRPPQTAAESPGLARKILVVDDARFFREMILDLLAPLNLPVLLAPDGESALETARREHPRLVILDLNLPGMDGYALIRSLRTEPALEGLRILAMSGVFRKDGDVAAVQQAGADDFTSKSFKPEQFLDRVKALLEE